MWKAGPQKASADDAQKWLGQRYQGHVKATEVKADRAQFGTPREFKNGTPPVRDRRASPLLLHIHHCANGKALPTALWLPSDFLKDKPAIPGSGQSAREFVEKLNP